MTLTSKLDFSQYWAKKKVKYFLCWIYVRSCAGLIALISKGNILNDFIFFYMTNFFLWNIDNKERKWYALIFIDDA